MDNKKPPMTPALRNTMLVIGTLIIILMIFEAGVAVGSHKAAFSFRTGDNYYRAFEGEGHRGPMQGMMRDGLPGANGAVGKILSITLPTMIIEDRERIEKVIVLTDDTVIRRMRDSITPQDLKPNDMVVVIGEPNADTQVEARLIRVLPPPPPSPAPSIAPNAPSAGTSSPD